MQIGSVFLLSSVQVIVRILAGVAVIKLVAVRFGPEGVAEFGQFQNLVTLLTMIGGAVFVSGITRSVAAAKTKVDLGAACFALAILFMSLSSVMILSVLIFSDQILQFLFGHLDYKPYLVPIAILASCMSGLMLYVGILNGQRRLPKIVAINTLHSLIMLGAALLLSRALGIKGIYVATVLGPGLVFIGLMAIHAPKLKSAFAGIKNVKIGEPTRELIKLGLMSGAGAIFLPIGQIVIRLDIIEQMSATEAGWWQGITRVSEVYLVFITAFLNFYFLPRVAALSQRSELKELIMAVTKSALGMAIILGIMVYVGRDLLILFIFSPEFLEMRGLFIWQILGDFVKVLSWVFAFVLLARGAMWFFIVGEIVSTISYVILARILLSQLGLEGVVIASGINTCFYLIYCYIGYRLISQRLPL